MKSSRRSASSMVMLTAAVVSVLYVLADRVVEDVLVIDSVWGEVLEVLVMGVVTSIALWAGVQRPLHLRSEAQQREAQSRQEQIERSAAQQRFESQLHRALEMAHTEDMALGSATKALAIAIAADDGDGGDAEILMADSSDAHLKQSVVLRPDGPARCNVGASHDCPAIRRSQTLQFPSSAALDACPHLEDRPSGACSAVCVPLIVGGRSIGVLHAVAPEAAPISTSQVGYLEAIATQAGSRIGMLRVMAATTLQAATDPLTGLLNRRSFENHISAMIGQDQPFALAMGDLDHFKPLNDTYGHEAGDRALRLFARILSTALRTDDLISRYGGEEFVVAFPNRTAHQAQAALERMQEQLIVALADGTIPPFTVSYGITDTTQSDDLDVLRRIADVALFSAKRSGRNRIEIDPNLSAPGVGHTDDTDISAASSVDWEEAATPM